MKVHGLTIQNELWGCLRDCQKESIKTALKYAKTPLSEEISEQQSCLLSLPTGAGKSGVITVLSHRTTKKKVLVLCHRRAVCDQLYRDISGHFFSKLQLVPEQAISLKPVYNNVRNTNNDGIYVTTFQMLQNLDAKELIELQDNIDLVIVDEGHSEPSPVWKELVRSINAHRIVITATPYRNDLFQFDIDENHSYISTFSQALEASIVENPSFEKKNAERIVDEVSAFFDNHPNTKCIVKCKTSTDVADYYTIFQAHFKTLAVHEDFTKDTVEHKKTRVPNKLAESDYQVIIHQRKLDEGVDIPQAKLLILTYAVGSGRELVQTIGRVVRIFNGIKPKIYELKSDSNARMWQNYLEFDKTLSYQNGQKKFLGSLDTSSLIDKYLAQFPDASYYGNRFLKKFDLSQFDPNESLVIPSASVCFYTKKSGFEISDFVDNIYWQLHHDGELVKAPTSTHNKLFVIVSISFNRSRFLRDQFFFEPSLEVTVVKDLGEQLVAVFDSRNKKYQKNKKTKLGSPISFDKIFKVAAQSDKTITREASSKSISSANRRPEYMMVKGKNLEEIANTQSNSAYALSTVRLDNYSHDDKKHSSYYVGISNGRISDQKESKFTLEQFDGWLDDIKGIIESDSDRTSSLIRSFSSPLNGVPTEPVTSVVFDLTENPAPLKIKINGVAKELPNTFNYFSHDNGFKLIDKIDDSFITVHLKNCEPFFEFKSNETLSFPVDDDETVSGLYTGNLLEYLVEKIHKVLFCDGKAFSEGSFYTFNLPSETGFSLADAKLSNVIYGLPELSKEGMTEKGNIKVGDRSVIQATTDSFSSSSVFYLLDQLKGKACSTTPFGELGPFIEFITGVDLILCADMGAEPADFIISSPEKLVYAHVKCGKTKKPGSSAGAIAEVGGQAIKNIEMLISNNKYLSAANKGRLIKQWPSDTDPNRLQERVRLLNRTRFINREQSLEARQEKFEELWKKVCERRSSTLVKKEIWLVTACAFSKSHFEKQMSRGNKAVGESLQAYQLIQSYIATAYSNDVELKIFTSE